MEIINNKKFYVKQNSLFLSPSEKGSPSSILLIKPLSFDLLSINYGTSPRCKHQGGFTSSGETEWTSRSTRSSTIKFRSP